MLIAEQHPAITAKEIVPEQNVYDIIWRFSVRANSQEEANAEIQKLTTKFAEMMGWDKPDSLIRLRP